MILSDRENDIVWYSEQYLSIDGGDSIEDFISFIEINNKLIFNETKDG